MSDELDLLIDDYQRRFSTKEAAFKLIQEANEFIERLKNKK